MAGRAKARRQPLKARRLAAWGGQMRWDSVAAQLGSAGSGWQRES
jgi:hypothetical protein